MMMQTMINQKGFSLLELLIALAILAVGLLALAGLQSTAMKADSVANRLSVASSLAQGVMEDIASWDITDPRLHVTAVDIVYDLDPNTAETSRVIPGAGTYGAVFSTTVNDPVTGLTRIVVTVNYAVPNGAVKAVSLTSYQRMI